MQALASKPLDPANPDGGNVYEGLDELLALYDNAISQRGSSSGGKYDALAQRLADKGFTAPLDEKLPKALRPLDVTECSWTVDLEDAAPCAIS